ncbi:hypothetical protein Aduo_002199 [Ancylostoma duodenale]
MDDDEESIGSNGMNRESYEFVVEDNDVFRTRPYRKSNLQLLRCTPNVPYGLTTSELMAHLSTRSPFRMDAAQFNAIQMKNNVNFIDMLSTSYLEQHLEVETENRKIITFHAVTAFVGAGTLTVPKPVT